MRTYHEIFWEFDVILYNSSQWNKFQIRNSSRISKLINTRTSFTKIVTRERGLHAYCAYKSILFANPATRLLKRAQEEKHQRNLTKFYEKSIYSNFEFRKKFSFTVSTTNHKPTINPRNRSNNNRPESLVDELLNERRSMNTKRDEGLSVMIFLSKGISWSIARDRASSLEERGTEREWELHMTSVKRLTTKVPPCVNCRSQGGIIHPCKVDDAAPAT